MEITKKDILKKLNKTDEIQIRDPEFEDKESPIEELIKKLSITKISPTKEKTIDEMISKLTLNDNKPKKIILRKPVAGPAAVAAAAIAVKEEIPKIEIINKLIEEKKVPKVTKRKVTLKRKPITGPIAEESEVIELGKKKRRSFSLSPMSIDFIQKRKKSRTPSPMKESPQYISDPRIKSLKSDEYVVIGKGGKKGKKTLKIKKY